MSDLPHNPKLIIAIDEKYTGDRLDKVLAMAAEDLSRARIQDLVKSGCSRVKRANNSATIKDPSYRVKCDDVVELDLPPPVDSTIKPQAIPLDVIFEDAALLVVNKPAGLVVHPAPGSPDGTSCLGFRVQGSMFRV